MYIKIESKCGTTAAFAHQPSRLDDLSIECKIQRADDGPVLCDTSRPSFVSVKQPSFSSKRWQFLPRPRPRHSALLARYSRPTNRAHARSHARMHARTAYSHACTHARRLVHTRCKQRHARTTLHLLCIYTTWL